MAPHVKNERVKLLRLMAQALNKLAEVDPETVDKYRSARAAFDALGMPEDQKYARIRSTKAAVIACLEHEKQWLPKRVIADLLFRGGFVMDEEYGPQLVVANIDKNIQRKHFVVDSEGRVGLPSWRT